MTAILGILYRNRSYRRVRAILAFEGQATMRTLNRFLKDDSGATAVEYGIMALGIALAIVAAVGLVGSGLADGVFTDMAELF
jgi:pilus assembly protein Flp/PilA